MTSLSLTQDGRCLLDVDTCRRSTYEAMPVHSMNMLKVFGLKDNLDLFNIVAVPDFSIVTCCDCFQINLKGGLSFSGDSKMTGLLEVEDPDDVHAVRQFIRKHLASELKPEPLSKVESKRSTEAHVYNRPSTFRHTLVMEDFYERMKQIVVIIKVKFPRGPSKCGTGFCLKNMILTCAHVIYKDDVLGQVFIQIYDQEKWYPVSVRYVDCALDTAILALTEELADLLPYGALCDEEDSYVGMSIHAIGHPQWFLYSFTTGELGFSAKTPRPYHDNHVVPMQYRKEAPNPTYMKDHFSVIELNNSHYAQGSSGCPLFDSQGKILGMLSFLCLGHDYGIHVKTLWFVIERSTETGNHSSRSVSQAENIDIKRSDDVIPEIGHKEPPKQVVLRKTPETSKMCRSIMTIEGDSADGDGDVSKDLSTEENGKAGMKIHDTNLTAPLFPAIKDSVLQKENLIEEEVKESIIEDY